MALRSVYIGSIGPFLYDDSQTYGDGVPLQGLRTDGGVLGSGISNILVTRLIPSSGEWHIGTDLRSIEFELVIVSAPVAMNLLSIYGATDGMIKLLLSTNNNLTVLHGNFLLAGSANFAMTTNSSLMLVFDAAQNKWIEVSRRTL